MRILLVDDDLDAEVLLRRWLPDHQIDYAPTYESATDCLGRHEYDLVFCDVRIPPFDPGEVCQLITVKWPSVPLIEISNDASIGIEKSQIAIRKIAESFQRKSGSVNQGSLEQTLGLIRRLRLTLQRENGNVG